MELYRIRGMSCLTDYVLACKALNCDGSPHCPIFRGHKGVEENGTFLFNRLLLPIRTTLLRKSALQLFREVTSLAWMLERLVWEVPARRTRSTLPSPSSHRSLLRPAPAKNNPILRALQELPGGTFGATRLVFFRVSEPLPFRARCSTSEGTPELFMGKRKTTCREQDELPLGQ